MKLEIAHILQFWCYGAESWRAHTHLVSLQTVKDTFLEIQYFSIIIFDFTPISNVEIGFFP